MLSVKVKCVEKAKVISVFGERNDTMEHRGEQYDLWHLQKASCWWFLAIPTTSEMNAATTMRVDVIARHILHAHAELMEILDHKLCLPSKTLISMKILECEEVESQAPKQK